MEHNRLTKTSELLLFVFTGFGFGARRRPLGACTKRKITLGHVQTQKYETTLIRLFVVEQQRAAATGLVQNKQTEETATNVETKAMSQRCPSGSNSGGENFMQTTNKLAHSNEHMRLRLVASVTKSRAHIHNSQFTHTHACSHVNQIYLSVNLCSPSVVAANATGPTDWPTNRQTYEQTSKLHFRTNDAISGDKMCASKWSNGTQTLNAMAIECGKRARVFVQNIWTIVIKINDRAQMRSHHVENESGEVRRRCRCCSKKCIRQWTSLEDPTLYNDECNDWSCEWASTNGHLSKIARDAQRYAFWYLIEFLFVLQWSRMRPASNRIGSGDTFMKWMRMTSDYAFQNRFNCDRHSETTKADTVNCRNVSPTNNRIHARHRTLLGRTPFVH